MFDDGAVVGTIAVAASDVDEAAVVDECGGDAWLAMSCCIHSCCSSVKPLSDEDETAIASTSRIRLQGRRWRGIHYEAVQVSIATFASAHVYVILIKCLCTCT